MNELFISFKNKINIKKVIIVVIIFLILLVSIILFFYFKHNKNNATTNETITNNTTYQTFNALDNSFEISISKKYNLKEYDPNNEYLLELRNDQNIDIFIAKNQINSNKVLKEIVEEESQSYIQKFKYYTEPSNITQIDNPYEYETYAYNFKYLDTKENVTYYLEVIWIKIDTNYYTIDVELPEDLVSTSSNIINEVISTFKIK